MHQVNSSKVYATLQLLLHLFKIDELILVVGKNLV